MTVIAWDGRGLAADKRATRGNLIATTTKIFRVGAQLCAYSGDADAGEELLAWYRDGADPAKFPPTQRDRDTFSSLLVITGSGEIKMYEHTPYPLFFSDDIFAIGSGRDFALGAMEMGADAVRAVEVACRFDSGCGNGIDVFGHGEP